MNQNDVVISISITITTSTTLGGSFTTPLLQGKVVTGIINIKGGKSQGVMIVDPFI